MSAEKYLTFTQALVYVNDEHHLPLSRQQLYHATESGDNPLPHIKISRRIYLRRTDIDTWIESQIAATSRG